MRKPEFPPFWSRGRMVGRCWTRTSDVAEDAGASPGRPRVPELAAPSRRRLGAQLGRVTRTSSTSTSTRLSGPPSTATKRRWIDLAGPRVQRDRGASARRRRRRSALPDRLKTTVWVPSAASTIGPERVGRRRVPHRGRRRSGRSAAGRARRAARRRRSGRSCARRGRAALTPEAGRQPGHERPGARGRRPELLRRRRAGRRPGCRGRSGPRPGPCRCRRDRPPSRGATSRSSSKAPQRAVATVGAEDRVAGTRPAPSGRGPLPCYARSRRRSASRPGSP